MAVAVLNESFELRILSGLHQGARVVLPGDGGAVVIGSDESCDFILRDSAIPARLLQLQQQGGAWVLQWLAGSGNADSAKPVLLPRDKAVSLVSPSDGSATDHPVFIVQPAHLPWPKVLPSLISRLIQNEVKPAAGADASQGVATATATATAMGSDGVDDKKAGVVKPSSIGAAHLAGANPAPVAVSVPSKSSQLMVVLLVLVAVLLIAFLAYGWFKQITSSQTAIDPLLNQAVVAARGQGADSLSLDKSRAAITAIATDLKLLPRVRIETAENGESGLLVRAGPLTDAETEALAAALSRLSPRPGLRVVSEFALREAVQEAVARQSTARSALLTATPLALGRFQVQGRLPENADREAVLAALQTEFAGMAVFESALQTSPDIAAKMVTELQNTGIALVEGQWQAGKLLLQAQMPKANLPLWEASLSRIAARYALPFTATLGWTANSPNLAANTTRAVGSANPRLQPGLPFALQSIIGGATPYVVTADGGKLLPGGSYQGWTLVDISAQRVLFQTAQGTKRVEVRR